MPRITTLVVCTLALTFCAGYAGAQTTEPADTLKVTYFSNANTTGAPDATVLLTNVDTSGRTLCADIYVFDPNQEMSECCSCSITPNGLLTLSVNTQLTANPLTTGKTLKSGTISIISAKNACGGLPTVITPAAGIKGWSTHIQNGNTITEEELVLSTFSSTELALLQTGCSSIATVGSGNGVCTCGTGGGT